MRHDVFVSYSQGDRECAFELTARLESHGISTWIAPRDVSPAADWAAEIIDAISAARCMVLVFSSHSNASPQVRREVERAVHKEIPVLPLRIENVTPSKSLEFFLSSQHWLDAFHPPRDPQYARLCAHLIALLKGGDPVLSKEGGVLRASERSTAAAGGTQVSQFSLDELQLLERQLAHHIGPVAKHLVRRAAATTADWDQLTRLLAAEVDSDKARHQFIDTCQTLARQRHVAPASR